jgi:hypothetical protein
MFVAGAIEVQNDAPARLRLAALAQQGGRVGRLTHILGEQGLFGEESKRRELTASFPYRPPRPREKR